MVCVVFGFPRVRILGGSVFAGGIVLGISFFLPKSKYTNIAKGMKICYVIISVL